MVGLRQFRVRAEPDAWLVLPPSARRAAAVLPAARVSRFSPLPRARPAGEKRLDPVHARRLHEMVVEAGFARAAVVVLLRESGERDDQRIARRARRAQPSRDLV